MVPARCRLLYPCGCKHDTDRGPCRIRVAYRPLSDTVARQADLAAPQCRSSPGRDPAPRARTLECPSVIARPPLPPGPFLVVGLARSGVAAARALRNRGGEVVGCDAGPVADEVRAELAAAGVPVHAPAEGVDLLPASSTVVKSPGVPQQAPVVVAARRQGLRVIGELEIGWRLLTNDFIAVTGSNGKTTTVELIGHMYRVADRPAVVAGNVGTALTSLARHARLRRDRGLRGVVVPARGHARHSRPTRRYCSTSPRTIWTGTAHSTRTGRRSCAPSPPSPRRRWRSRPRTWRRTCPARRRGSRSARTATWTTATGSCGGAARR